MIKKRTFRTRVGHKSQCFTYLFRYRILKASDGTVLIAAKARNTGGSSDVPMTDEDFSITAARKGERALQKFREHVRQGFPGEKIRFRINAVPVGNYSW